MSHQNTVPIIYFNNNIFFCKFKKCNLPCNAIYCNRNIQLSESRLWCFVNWQDWISNDPSRFTKIVFT
jgi:hypothetical protein